MKPSRPPRLSPRASEHRPASRLRGGVVLLALAAGLVAARLVARWQIPLPRCALRSLTGIPCPFCGSTHAMIALAHVDVHRALALNPLATALALGAALWAILYLFGLPLDFGPLLRRIPSRILWIGALVILALNWLYVWTHLPP